VSLGSFCRIATPFTKSGEIDETALRKLLQRFVKSRIGIYLGSAGAGETHALRWEELERIYEIGLVECKGKIPVYANPPEQYTVRATREYISQAIDAGCELVSIYGLASRHGMKPTDLELGLYFKEVLAGIKHPMSIAVNQPITGYMPKASLIAEVCNRHRQVEAINLSYGGDAFFLQLKDRLKRDIPIYVHLNGSVSKLMMSARGVFGTEANIIPKTQRRYLEAFESRNFGEVARITTHIVRFADLVSQWSPSVPRALKMAMRFLKLPGGEGGLREPYRMPPPEEYRRFTTALMRLGIPEIEEQARAAGIRV
jgi:dihydrodipicolinate synthase/N-acetylneuraminate lyase